MSFAANFIQTFLRNYSINSTKSANKIEIQKMFLIVKTEYRYTSFQIIAFPFKYFVKKWIVTKYFFSYVEEMTLSVLVP